MNIESTKTVYLDGQEYTRVFFEGSDYFEDVPSENYDLWVEANGHTENA